MKIMQSKFPGKCSACGSTIRKGETIAFFGRGNARHESCANGEGVENVDPETAAMLASDRASYRRGVSVTRFSSGAVMYQNRRGRCEDAPCCGCCS